MFGECFAGLIHSAHHDLVDLNITQLAGNWDDKATLATAQDLRRPSCVVSKCNRGKQHAERLEHDLLIP